MQKSNAEKGKTNLLKYRNLGLRALSLSDQIMFSAANFILTLLLAKNYSDTEVAGFGIGLSIALIIQSIQRTCYVVQNSLLAPPIFCKRADKVMGQHLIAWGIILAVEIALAAALYTVNSDDFHFSILVSTVVCSLIYAQLDFDRIVLLKHEKYVDPFLASAAFLLLNAALYFAIPQKQIPFVVTMGLVGLYAFLKIIRLVFLIGKPDFFWGWRLVKKDYQRYLWGSLVGTASYSGYSSVPLFILGYVAAPAQTAAFVALRGLMQPLQVIIRSLDVIDKNLFNAGSGHSKSTLRNILFRQLIVYGGLSLLAFAGVELVGRFFLHLIYGEKYMTFFDVLLGWAAISGLMAVTYPLETTIIRLGKLHQYNVWRGSAGILGVLLSWWLCPTMGAMGAVWASLGGWLLSVTCAVWLIREVLTFSSSGDSHA